MKLVHRSEQLRQAALAKHRWEAKLRRDERKRRRAPEADNQRRSIRISPPANFSFSRNYHATVRCLQALKSAVFTRDQEGRYPEIFLDLSRVRRISLAGALVLGAEVHRWRQQRGPGMRTRNLKNWDPRVRRILASLGFFNLLDVKVPYHIKKQYDANEVTILPMISSTGISQDLLRKIQSDLQAVAELLDQDPTVYAALVEAAYNTVLHAYPKDHEFEFPATIKGWWATASWNPEEGCVKFIVFDQGVGIPATLPKWEGWEQLRSWITKKFGGLAIGLNDNSNLIEAAIKIDRTSLKGGHGKGLQDVIAPVDITPKSSVRILSGAGSLLYDSDGTVTKKDETLHIGGTLIEWRIPVGTHEIR